MATEAPMLIITNVGLAAASVATPTGPFIEIVGFKVGSAYGYTPLPTDTDINGNLLFEGAPSTYRYVGDNTLDIVCKLPADAGPFDFGEVAVMMPSNVMFAKAAFPDPQTKYTSLGTNVLSTYTFHCLLKLAQAVAVFKVDTINGEPPSIWEVDFWSDVYPPALSANPEIPAILVRELDEHGNSSLIHQADDATWTVGTNYHFYDQAEVNGATINYVDVVAAELSEDVLSNIDREFVVAFDSGYLRSVSSVELVGPVYRFNMIDAMVIAPPAGSVVTIYTNRAPVGPTQLNVTGDATGTVLIAGGTATLSLTLSAAAVNGRFVEFNTPGTYPWTVPDEVFDIFIDGGGAGAGGGGAGGGFNVNHVPNDDYLAGGGAGGGGAGVTEVGYHMSVTPGEIITIVVGVKGIGGVGGVAPGNNGNSGTAGGDSSVTAVSDTLLLPGGTSGGAGTGYGPPSGLSGAGGPPGIPGGAWGTDGHFGGAGGNGGSGSPFGSGGAGARAATGPAGIDGDDATGNCSGGGGGGAVYHNTATGNGGDGGDGTDGLIRIKY